MNRSLSHRKRQLNGCFRCRALFGSDSPFALADRSLSDFETAGYKPRVIENGLYANAQGILGLKTWRDPPGGFCETHVL